MKQWVAKRMYELSGVAAHNKLEPSSGDLERVSAAYDKERAVRLQLQYAIETVLQDPYSDMEKVLGEALKRAEVIRRG